MLELTTIDLTIYFKKGYVADPYWTELTELIDIQKESGMNRARSEKNRADALATYLARQGMTPEDYAKLEALARRPWYRVDSDDESTEIIVSSHQLYGCLIEAAKQAPAALRLCEPDNLRHMIELSDFSTGKTKEDGIYKRAVMPKSGAGQPLSNQRTLRSDPYIEKFEATGTLRYYAEELRDKGEYLVDFLRYAGQRVGVGAARKMGFGRYEVRKFKVA